MIPKPAPRDGSHSRKPRASGDDPGPREGHAHRRHVNPARAGMILPLRTFAWAVICKPRASGDDPNGKPARTTWAG